jgi:small subunit ribosomal protein S16
MGTKARPFYRVVVAKSTSARDGAFVEVIGTYNPLTKPHQVNIKSDRAMYWLMEGAQPTETVAYLLKNLGVLDEYLAKRPNAKRSYKFLDKRTAAMAKKSVVEAPVAAAVAAPASAPAPAPAAEPAPEPVVEAAPVAEASPEPVAEAPAAEQAAAPVEATE